MTAAGIAAQSEIATAASGQVVTPTFPLASRAGSGTIRVVCSEQLTDAQADQVRNAAPGIDLVLADRSNLKSKAADAEVILGWVDRDTALSAKNLKWVQAWAAGVETIPVELMQHPCVLTNMQRVFAPVIAESAIALLLSLTRGIAQHAVPNFIAHKWQRTDLPLEDLFGKTLGVVGLGGIGSETAWRLHYGFRMRVLAVDPKPIPRPEFVEVLREPAWLPEMAGQVDVLLSSAPLTRETRGLFNESIFRAMRRSAYFINVSRGGLVDQVALARALKEGWIRGAGLDVTSPEPLPADDPLWACPNLVITPHNSGAAPVREVRQMALVVENLRRYAQGLPLLNVVDKARGY